MFNYQHGFHFVELEDDLVENMCIFCGEENPKFAQEGGLDIHYWKSCPLLQRCDGCSQVRIRNEIGKIFFTLQVQTNQM